MTRYVWEISYKCNGNIVLPSELDDDTLEYIARLVEEGYTNGEVLDCNDENRE